MSNPKLLVIGHAGHGKDTVCNILHGYGWTFQSSSRILLHELIFPALKDKYGYADSEQCFIDRINHRQEWFELLAEYNKDDAARMGKLIFSKYDIYCGLRNVLEYNAMLEEGLFDYCIWVDASKRLPPEPKESMQLTKYAADYLLDNNRDLQWLRMQIDSMVYKIRK
jgi:dephospho-CoA kinase